KQMQPTRMNTVKRNTDGCNHELDPDSSRDRLCRHAVVKKREFLVFRIGDQEYGIDIRNVRELSHYATLARVRRRSQLIDGVVISRGDIMPMVDMRIHFHPVQPLYEDRTVVVILSIADCAICMVVDSASEVIALTPEQVKPIPQICSAFDTRCLIGLAECSHRSVLLVDIDHVMHGSRTESSKRMVA
ncbi:MAG: chemotaxis protein CheW, partial [Noviherbaspirillum sp.]